jgi:papain like protease
MAPGVFVRLDCREGPPVVATGDVFSPEKLALLAAGLLHLSHDQPAPTPAQPIEPAADLVDHRTEGLEGPVKDQGSVGDCTAFSLSTAMDNAILRLKKKDVVSPLHIWSHYGSPEVSLGVSSNLGKPIALLGVLPYSPKQACELAKDPEEQCGQVYGVRTNSATLDPVLQAQLTRAEASGGYRLAAVDRVSGRPVNTDAIAAILRTGADVLAGMEIDSVAWKVGPNSPVIPDYTAHDGGHGIVVCGYRKVASGRQFLLHNSWGGTWGDHGFAWISEAMVQKHMEYAFKVRVTDPNGAESRSQTDDECPDHQLVDAGTGKCAPMCRNRTRSTNGKC